MNRLHLNTLPANRRQREQPPFETKVKLCRIILITGKRKEVVKDLGKSRSTFLPKFFYFFSAKNVAWIVNSGGGGGITG